MTVMRTVEKELVARDGKYKIELFRRADGSYGFSVFKWSDEPNEHGWLQFGRYSECFAQNLAAVEAEARSRVDWLRSGDA